MTARAKNPERVLDKVRECRFFLVQMADYEELLDSEKFLFCLSAFMSAFRLYGVTENRLGEAAKHRLKHQLHGHSEINFLILRTNVELHEDGAVVFQRFTVVPRQNDDQLLNQQLANRSVTLLKSEAQYSQSFGEGRLSGSACQGGGHFPKCPHVHLQVGRASGFALCFPISTKS